MCRTLVLVVASFVPLLPTEAGEKAARPNIILVLADDLGFGDVSCYNPASKITTRHMDRLAAQGMRFVDAHSPSSVCTPTRYGILTGQYCWRTKLKSGVLEGLSPPLIDKNRLTVAGFLQRLRYLTACIGKWHLGLSWTRKEGVAKSAAGEDIDYARGFEDGPTTRGFDSYFGISASLDMPPYCFLEGTRTVGLPNKVFPGDGSLYLNLRRGVIAEGFKHSNVMPMLSKKTVEFIERQKDSDKPFFLYAPLTAPHVPIVPNAEFVGKSECGKYGDLVLETDAFLGAVMDALERTGQADNTLLIMTSDNGSWWHYWEPKEADDKTSGRISGHGAAVKKFGHQGNGPWRGLKADIWEGGHRIPFIARWPGKIRPGTTSGQLISLQDLFATCAAIGESVIPDDAAEDSVSFLPALLGRTEDGSLRKSVIHHSFQGQFALREGRWLLIPTRGSAGFSPPQSVKTKPGEPTGQLYDLDKDPAQTSNRWNDEPQVVKQMTNSLRTAQQHPRTR